MLYSDQMPGNSIDTDDSAIPALINECQIITKKTVKLELLVSSCNVHDLPRFLMPILALRLQASDNSNARLRARQQN
jgi:hypothetical protein